MIIYLADRQLTVLAIASTSLPSGLRISDDSLVRRVEGADSFECTLDPGDMTLPDLEKIIYPCNHIILLKDSDVLLFSILETEFDSESGEIRLYSEGGGLDLLNDIVRDFPAPSSAQGIEYYMNAFLSGTGFTVGTNEIPTLTRTLSWSGESTITKRIQSVATEFGAEIGYSFDITGTTITGRHVDIYQRIGKDIGEPLRAGNEIDHITVKRSAENLATAILPIASGVSLSGSTYDDGDFYVDGEMLKSRKALDEWSRVSFDHIVKTYQSQATTQANLLTETIRELRKACQLETTYDVNLVTLPEGVAIGDTIHMVDVPNGIYLTARIMQLDMSETSGTKKATLGEITEET